MPGQSLVARRDPVRGGEMVRMRRFGDAAECSREQNQGSERCELRGFSAHIQDVNAEQARAPSRLDSGP